MDPKDMKMEGKEVLEEANDLQAMTLEKSRLDWFFNEVFPIRNFHKLLSKKDVLNLRKVCEDWRVTVDNALEMTNDVKELDCKSYKSIMTSPALLLKREEGIHKPLVLLPSLIPSTRLALLWKDMARHSRNPFLSRQAFFSCMFDDERCYWTHVSAVLGRFGEELRSMYIQYRSELATAEMLRMVQECLTKTPQLTNLDCFFVNVSRGADLSNQVVFPEFPPLPNLNQLSIHFRGCPFIDQLSVYFEQLVSLDVRLMDDFLDSLDPKIHSTFPSLQHLAVGVRDQVDLLKLHSFTSKLKEVDLRSAIPDNFCLSVYFHILEHFKETLSVIKIERKLYCAEETLTWAEQPALDLPNLKVLRLAVMSCGFGGMDTISKLTCPLEYLEIAVLPCRCGDGYDGQHERQRIQIDLDDMYKSTIWDLLPSLQQIVIDPLHLLKKAGDRNRNCYTRTMYEVKQRDGNPKAAKRPRQVVDSSYLKA